jgi:hypothetical protein
MIAPKLRKDDKRDHADQRYRVRGRLYGFTEMTASGGKAAVAASTTNDLQAKHRISARWRGRRLTVVPAGYATRDLPLLKSLKTATVASTPPAIR